MGPGHEKGHSKKILYFFEQVICKRKKFGANKPKKLCYFIILLQYFILFVQRLVCIIIFEMQASSVNERGRLLLLSRQSLLDLVGRLEPTTPRTWGEHYTTVLPVKAPLMWDERVVVYVNELAH